MTPENQTNEVYSCAVLCCAVHVHVHVHVHVDPIGENKSERASAPVCPLWKKELEYIKNNSSRFSGKIFRVNVITETGKSSGIFH